MNAGLQQNYFELFGLPVVYDIDAAVLSAHYRELQRNIHPDKFTQAADTERRLAMQLTARANEALQTLKDPVRRGRYMLELRGVNTDEETDTAMNPEFLMAQMAVRERLEQARATRDVAAARALEGELASELAGKGYALGAQLTENTPQTSARARALVREMQFLQKALAEIQALEEEVA